MPFVLQSVQFNPSKTCLDVEREFTSLDNIYPDVRHNSINLLPKKLGGDMVYAVHAEGVLGCEGCGGRHGVAAVGGDDFLVCFQAAGHFWG